MISIATDRLRSSARASFAPIPWHDQHPDKLDVEQRLPADHLAFRIDQASLCFIVVVRDGGRAVVGAPVYARLLLILAALKAGPLVKLRVWLCQTTCRLICYRNVRCAIATLCILK